MKTKMFLIAIASLLLFTGIWGCSSNEENERVIESKEITSFFESTLLNGEDILQYSFPSLYSQRDTCYMVNSRAELKDLYAGDKELPQIDFDKCTLVIGKVSAVAGYSLRDQTIDVTDDSIVVTLTLKGPGDGFALLQFGVPYYFWGLYEKLPQKNVVITIKNIF